MMLYYKGDLQANGFRSMLRVVNTLVRHCSDIIIIIIIIIIAIIIIIIIIRCATARTSWRLSVTNLPLLDMLLLR